MSTWVIYLGWALLIGDVIGVVVLVNWWQRRRMLADGADAAHEEGSFEDVGLNPSTGLPMLEHSGMDYVGNPYGCSGSGTAGSGFSSSDDSTSGFSGTD